MTHAWKIKLEGDWDFFDGGYWKSENICNLFQRRDRKFKHLWA